jgi:hypothetical protein
MTNVASNGFYSLDANFLDYLADRTAPWVAEGDRVKLEMMGQGEANSTMAAVLSINLSEDRQEVKI